MERNKPSPVNCDIDDVVRIDELERAGIIIVVSIAIGLN